MNKIRIFGGNRLNGEVRISGAKNAILPILAATLLTKGEVILENVPDLSDVHVMLELMRELGSDSSFDVKNNRLIIFAKSDINHKIGNSELASKVRTSSLFMGPLLAVNGRVEIPAPGGCNLGTRAIDMHLHFFKEMGANVEEGNGYIKLEAKNKICGIEANFYKTSVGATQNIMIAAALAEGRTIIEGASLEPEVGDLGNFLISIGVKIKGLGTSRIEIEGSEDLLQEKPYEVMCDRLEAGTYAIAALATKGEVVLKNAPYRHLKYFLEILKNNGAEITADNGDLLVRSIGKRVQAKSISTAPHPYFPTDLQQIYTTLMTTAEGISIIEENIFDGRFLFAKELEKMNAKIYYKDDRKIIVEGTDRLISSKDLHGKDLRGSMALFIAALKADGESVLHNSRYLTRGYENFHQKFSGLGACIEV